MVSEVTKKAIPTLFGSLKGIPRIDSSLTMEGCCADAKAVGDRLREATKAINFSYDGKGNGLNAETIQEAIDELNENNKVVGNKELLCSSMLDNLHDIDASKYRFIYYELRTNTGLCMISNPIPTAILTEEVQEYNHTEYVNATYNAEITVQIKSTSIKAYKKSLAGWNLSVFNVYGIY